MESLSIKLILNNIDVKKQIIGDKYIVPVDLILIPV